MSNLMKIAFIGECMVEFNTLTDNGARRFFSGDTFNAAYYCKKAASNLLFVDYVTALGYDVHSDDMLIYFAKQNMGVEYIRRIPDKKPGSYWIELNNGERSFKYDRANSAAKYVFDGVDGKSLLKKLLDSQFDAWFFSGITLAILTKEGIDHFRSIIFEAKTRGTKIIFDTNYRPKLWPNKDLAKETIRSFLPAVDIALPSFDDEQALFGDQTLEETADRFLIQGVTELIVKNAAAGYLMATPKSKTLIEIEPVKNVVDTTAAGDSFDGTYIANRLMGSQIKEAAERAALVAAKVIRQYGAIVDV